MQSWIVASVARGPDQTLQGFGIAMWVKKKVIVTTPKRTAMSCKRRFPTKITKSLGLRPIDLRPPEPTNGLPIHPEESDAYGRSPASILRCLVEVCVTR